MDEFDKLYEKCSSVSEKLYIIAFYFMKYGVLGLGVIFLNPIIILFGVMFNYMLTTPTDGE